MGTAQATSDGAVLGSPKMTFIASLSILLCAALGFHWI